MNDLLTQLNGGNVPTLELMFMLTLAALLPSIVVMMTSFTRTIIILSFTRNAMGVQQAPPNMVLVGIAMFLTLYIMSPVIDRQIEQDVADYPLTVVVPAFMTSELKRGFTAGFLIYLPFLLVDIIVSTTLMSMGMVMLPPAMISLPFKLLLFVTVDGWELLFTNIVAGFR